MRLKSLSLALLGLTLTASSLATPLLAQQSTVAPSKSEQIEPALTEQDVLPPTLDDADQEPGNEDPDIGPVVEDNSPLEIPDQEEADAEKSKALNLEQPQMLAKASKSGRRMQALRLAKKEIGYREGRLNCNKFSSYFYPLNPRKQCQYWCADFVSWAFDQAGNKDKRLPWKNPSTVRSVHEWAKQNKQVVKTPQAGDLFLQYKRGSDGKIQTHMGFVASVHSKVFRTIEGNANNRVLSRSNLPIRGSAKEGTFYFVRVQVPT